MRRLFVQKVQFRVAVWAGQREVVKGISAKGVPFNLKVSLQDYRCAAVLTSPAILSEQLLRTELYFEGSNVRRGFIWLTAYMTT